MCGGVQLYNMHTKLVYDMVLSCGWLIRSPAITIVRHVHLNLLDVQLSAHQQHLDVLSVRLNESEYSPLDFTM